MPYTIIGQDSALLKNFLHNVTTFSISSAERIDLLIKFDSNTWKEGDTIQLNYTANDTDPYIIPIRIGER